VHEISGHPREVLHRAYTKRLKPLQSFNPLRRAGVPREAAMRLVNHSSELIHQIYQRERVEDVAQWRDAVKFPA